MFLSPSKEKRATINIAPLVLLIVLFYGVKASAQTSYQNTYEEQAVNFTASMGSQDKEIIFHVNKYTTDNYLSTDLAWTFGDGSTASGYNPTHTYANAGTYQVCLSVDGGTNYSCKDDVFTVTETGLKVKYVNDANIMWPNGDRNDLGSPFTYRITANGYRFDFHRALDIEGTHGDPIKAIADGKVRASYTASSGTEIIALEHIMDTPMYFHGKVVSAYYTRYLHLTDRYVENYVPGSNPPVQTTVSKGDIIGTLGSTGSGTYKHNHFEIRVGNFFSKITFDNGSVTSQGHNLWHGELDANGNQLLIDPDVNPLMFIDTEIEQNNTLRYSTLKDGNSLYVKVYTTLLDNHFNEIGFKHNGVTEPIVFNFNTREGLPYSPTHGNAPDDYANYSSGGNNTANLDYDYRNGIDGFDIYPIRSLTMKRNGLEIIFRFDNVDFTGYKDDYSTPNGNFLYVRDIYGNLGEKTTNNIVINEVNFESKSGDLSQDYNKDGNTNFRDDFVEIVNNSSRDINMNGYKIFDRTRIDQANLDDLFDASNITNPRFVIPEYDADGDGNEDDDVILAPGQVLLIFTYINVNNLPTEYDDPNIIVFSVREQPDNSPSLVITQDEAGERMVLTNEQNGILDIASNSPFSLPMDYMYSIVRQEELTGDFVLVTNNPATPGVYSTTFSTPTVGLKDYLVYPNPVNNTLFLSDNSFKTFMIYDSLGKQIKFGEISNNTIDFSQISKGLYFVRFINESGLIIDKKIIKL